MKNILTAILGFLCISLGAQKEISSKIDSVTVYLNGAQVYKSLNLPIKKGYNQFVIKDLATTLFNDQFQIVLPEGMQITHLSSTPYPINTPKDSLTIIQDKIDQLQAELDRLNFQISTLSSIYTRSEVGTLADILTHADQASSKYQDALIKSRKITKQKAKLQTKWHHLKEIAGVQNQNKMQMAVTIYSETTKEVQTTMSYLVSGAGWVPYYDIFLTELSKPIELVTAAKVFNTTGEDWPKLTLKFSTSDPFASLQMPELEKWTLGDYSNLGYRYQASDIPQQFSQSNAAFGAFDLSQTKSDAHTQMGNVVSNPYFQNTIKIPALSKEWKGQIALEIPANGKVFQTRLESRNVPAEFRYKAIPKLEKHPYLFARLTDWEEFGLTEGKINIYMNNQFMGQSFMKPFDYEDTLQISIGQDKNIVFKYKKKKEYTSKSLIGNKYKDENVFEITCINHRKDQIQLEVKDQLPISQTSDIEVIQGDITGAAKDENGILYWNISLQPNSKQSFEFSYTVKYDKNRKILYKNKRYKSSAAYML